jgi:hypothetical protein
MIKDGLYMSQGANTEDGLPFLVELTTITDSRVSCYFGDLSGYIIETGEPITQDDLGSMVFIGEV